MASVVASALLGACGRDAPRADAPSRSPTEQVADATPSPRAGGAEANVTIADAGRGADAARALSPTGARLLPLANILEIVRARVPGEVIEVELEDEDGRFEYEVTILTADGRAIETTVDASTGTIRKSEED